MVFEHVELTPDASPVDPDRDRHVFVSALFRDKFGRGITSYVELSSRQHPAAEIEAKIAAAYAHPEQSEDFFLWIRTRVYAKRPGFDGEAQGPAPKLEHIDIALPGEYPIDTMGQLLENYDYADPKNPQRITKFLFHRAPPRETKTP